MLAAVRDAWRVTFTGGRPVAIRLSAAMVVVLLLATVGSVGGLAAVGAWSVLNPPSTAPAPSPSVDHVPVVVPPVQPSAPLTMPPSTMGPESSMSPAPMQSQRPTPSMTPMHTPRPTTMPMPKPTAKPIPTQTHHPEPTSMPQPTHHPEPSHDPGHG